jgi:hypothetical protein
MWRRRVPAGRFSLSVIAAPILPNYLRAHPSSAQGAGLMRRDAFAGLPQESKLVPAVTCSHFAISFARPSAM